MVAIKVDHKEIQTRRDNKKKKHKTSEARTKYIYGPCTKEHSLANNPLHRDGMNYDNRKVTDIFCLVFFIAVVGTMVGFSTYGFIFGNSRAVIGGMDGAGNLCGVSGQADGDFTDYPEVYISDFSHNTTANIFPSALCVKYCPVDDKVLCKHNTLFKKGGTCENYLALNGKSEYP
jgi:hypothetical protein